MGNDLSGAVQSVPGKHYKELYHLGFRSIYSFLRAQNAFLYRLSHLSSYHKHEIVCGRYNYPLLYGEMESQGKLESHRMFMFCSAFLSKEVKVLHRYLHLFLLHEEAFIMGELCTTEGC